MPSVLVIGEALVDVVQYLDGTTRNIPGGSPANTAVALSRLGVNTFMKARMSTDKYGIQIKKYLTDQSINLNHSLFVNDPSSVIEAQIQSDGSAKYSANLVGASDYGWQKDELNQEIDSEIKVVHLGSLTSYVQPGATNVENWFNELRNSNKYFLSFDPNIRHPLDGQPEKEVRERAKKLASLANVVKASDEDLRWINPGKSLEDTALELIESGTNLVVITLGKLGAIAMNQQKELVQIQAEQINVVDTIGAGDTFSAALILQLIERGLLDSDSLKSMNKNQIQEILLNCAQASAITCSREGANPPTRKEVTW